MILTENIKLFLIEYVPKSQRFTSKDEIDLISNKLNLNELSITELMELRDIIVEFYSSLFDKETYVDNNGTIHATEEYWKTQRSMQSVVSVIDFKLFN